MFMHGGFGHIALNMLGLFMLGPPLEYRWGSQRFLTYYLVTGVGAALFYSGVHAIEYIRLANVLGPEAVAAVKSQGMELWAQGRNYTDDSMSNLNALLNIPMLGASGAIYGVLLAFGMTFPNVELMVFPLHPDQGTVFRVDLRCAGLVPRITEQSRGQRGTPRAFGWHGRGIYFHQSVEGKAAVGIATVVDEQTTVIPGNSSVDPRGRHAG